MTDPDILARLERVESTLAIQQLVARYAIAVDTRDIDAWVGLFIVDVDCGRRGKGRDALRSFIEPAVREFYRSVHQICGHVIDFDDADHAHGTVYCRAEHEAGDGWIVQACVYADDYERREGQWYFVRRNESFFYTADLLEHPQDAGFARWPGSAPRHAPKMMPARFPSWSAFWADSTVEQVAAITRLPIEGAAGRDQ